MHHGSKGVVNDHIFPRSVIRTLLALALAAGLTSFAVTAKAGQTFNWSFTGNFNAPEIGYYLDTIGGTLTLNNAGTAATSVVVTSNIGGHVPFDSYDFATGSASLNVYLNRFSVDGNGAITEARFDYWEPSLSLTLSWPGSFAQYMNDGTKAMDQAGLITFTPIPEPSTYALFGIGAIGMLMVMRRKKKTA